MTSNKPPCFDPCCACCEGWRNLSENAAILRAERIATLEWAWTHALSDIVKEIDRLKNT